MLSVGIATVVVAYVPDCTFTTCNTVPAGNLALANVPDEMFVAFKDVSDAPEPDGESTSVPITNPNDVLAADADVAAVPPEATGKALASVTT